MIDLDTLITQAAERRSAAQLETVRADEQRINDARARFHERVTVLFGADILGALDAKIAPPDSFDDFRAVTLTFRSRGYSLRNARDGEWRLTRCDRRAADDELERPHCTPQEGRLLDALRDLMREEAANVVYSQE